MCIGRGTCRRRSLPVGKCGSDRNRLAVPLCCIVQGLSWERGFRNPCAGVAWLEGYAPGTGHQDQPTCTRGPGEGGPAVQILLLDPISGCEALREMS